MGVAYQWNGAAMWDTITLPKSVGNYIKMASPLQWQVLLWLATAGHGQGDAAACAVSLGNRVTEADCAEALAFWVQEGILQQTDTPSVTVTPVPVVVDPQPVIPPVTPKVRPNVIKTASANADYTFVLETASSKFSKALSHYEMERIADLLTERQLPAEVVLMAVQVSLSRKKTLSYALRVADGWADEGLLTVEQVNERLCELERCDRAGDRLAELFPDLPKPSATARKMAAIWLFDWQLPDDLLLLARDRSADKKSVYAYMNRLLESWHAAGLLTPEAVLADENPNINKKKPSETAADGGFDLDKYSAMLDGHLPSFRGKGE